MIPLGRVLYLRWSNISLITLEEVSFQNGEDELTSLSVDQNFIRTFMFTFKSFAKVQEIFELLVARFNIALPEGLDDAQREEWNKVKQTPSQVRYVLTDNLKCLLSSSSEL